MRPQAWILLLVAACGPAPHPQGSQPPTLSIEPSSGELPKEVAAGEEVAAACEVATEDLSATDQRWWLTLEDGATVWGYLHPSSGGSARVTLEGERVDAIGYDFSGDGVRLAGRTLTDHVDLYAERPLWFERVVVAEPQAALSWRKANADEVTLEMQLDEDFSPSRLSGSAACEQLTLERPNLEMEAIVDLDGLQTWVVDGDDPVPIYADPDSHEAVLTYAAGDGTELSGGELAAERRRIVIQRSRYTLVGWVPATRLRLPTGLRGYGTGRGGGFGTGGLRGKPQRRDYRCDESTKLIVEVNGKREAVGSLESRRPIWVDDLEPIEDGWRPLHFDDSPVALARSARWMIEVATLDGCRLVP